MALTMVSCGGKYFRAPCKLENYGIIELHNHTDTGKSAFVKRFYDNEEIDSDWIAGNVEAKTIHVYRLHPGIYSIGVRFPETVIQGRPVAQRDMYLFDANSPRKDKRYSLAQCQTLTFNLEYVKIKTEFKIRPRATRR